MAAEDRTYRASSGTLESCDALVTVEAVPAGSSAGGSLEVVLHSPLESRYGGLVRSAVEQTWSRLAEELVPGGAGRYRVRIEVEDHGALDYVLRARVEAAVRRAFGEGGSADGGS